MTVLLVGAALVVGYLLLKNRKPKPTPPAPTTNGREVGDGNLPSDGSDPTFTPCAPVAMDYGCSGNYQDTCGTINFGNPQSNVGCCGEMVYKFQCALNQYQAFGLEEDGQYGPLTLQAHQTIRSQAAIPPNFPGVNFSF